MLLCDMAEVIYCEWLVGVICINFVTYFITEGIAGFMVFHILVSINTLDTARTVREKFFLRFSVWHIRKLLHDFEYPK